jgi:hypothetical protein
MIFAIALLALCQMPLLLVLIVKTVRWMKRHPMGADPQDEFAGFMVCNLLLGGMLTWSVLIAFGLPSLNDLMNSHSATQQEALVRLGFDFLALTPLFPSLGLLPMLRGKVNLLALLTGFSLLSNVAAILMLGAAMTSE